MSWMKRSGATPVVTVNETLAGKSPASSRPSRRPGASCPLASDAWTAPMTRPAERDVEEQDVDEERHEQEDLEQPGRRRQGRGVQGGNRRKIHCAPPRTALGGPIGPTATFEVAPRREPGTRPGPRSLLPCRRSAASPAGRRGAPPGMPSALRILTRHQGPDRQVPVQAVAHLALRPEHLVPEGCRAGSDAHAAQRALLRIPSRFSRSTSSTRMPLLYM